MIHYTLNLSNIPFFNIISNGTEHIKKKQIILFNTFNIHENATLPLLLYLYLYLYFEKFFQIM
jgi:hypothetical protein